MTKYCLILIAVTSVTAGCAITAPREINEKYKDVLEQRQTDYRLKEGDTVDLQFYGVEADRLSQPDIRVLPDGRSDLFFMESTRLAGKSVPELESDVRDHIANEVEGAEIKIQVSPIEETVFMVGEFETPGPLPLTVKMTVKEAISAAGGIMVTADSDWALLRRPYSNPESPDLFRIDLNDHTEDIFLLPGDQVVLPKTFIASAVLYTREYIFGFLPPGIWSVAVATSRE